MVGFTMLHQRKVLLLVVIASGLLLISILLHSTSLHKRTSPVLFRKKKPSLSTAYSAVQKTPIKSAPEKVEVEKVQVEKVRVEKEKEIVVPKVTTTPRIIVSPKLVDVLITDLEELEQREVDRNFTGVRRRLPAALTLGVEKCGTEALHLFLSANSMLSPVMVETNFLAFEDKYDGGFDAYRELMPATRPNQLTIDLGTFYLTSPGVLERVQSIDPDLKLIVVVCNPVARDMSHYGSGDLAAEGRRRDLSFEKMFFNSRGQVNEAAILYRYDEIVTPWLDLVGSDQIHFVDGTALRSDPVEQLNLVEDFLGVPREIDNENIIFNNAKGSFCKFVNGKETCPTIDKGLPSVNRENMLKLHNHYHPHTEKFFDLIGQRFEWNAPK